MSATFLQAFVTLFAILDPLGNTPVFLALTANLSAQTRRGVALRATVYMVAVLLFFSLAGRFIFGLFGVTLAAFRVTGGLILLKVGFDMLEARDNRMKRTDEEEAAAREKEDVSLIPLAVPMLAGPGAISAVLMLTDAGHGLMETAMVWAAVAANAALVFAAFRLAEPLSRWMGATGERLVTRLMGLLLVSLAIQFVIKGVQEIWTG